MIDLSSFVETLKGRPVAVFGLGLSNMAAVRALVKAGARVVAWDDRAEARAEALKAGAELRDFMQEEMGGYACLVLAPGVPLHYPAPHPVAARARAARVEIICDIEILHRCGHGRKVIGITGTNGKSTTTALVAHILKECGVPVAMGGNIGYAVLALDMPPPDGVFVLELSSYQLDLCPTFAPEVGVLLNLTPDHIDRHGSMEGYVGAKMNLFHGSGHAVVAVDDEWTAAMAASLKEEGWRTVVTVSSGDTEWMKENDIGAIPALQGVHNAQNAAAAFEAVRLIGVPPARIFAAMKSFPGLPHRQFVVRVINGVSYINDSKATNAAATVWALACRETIYWIVGGEPKEGGLAGLEPYMERIEKAFLIGAAMEEFGAWLETHHVPYQFCGTMEQAVADAHEMAQEAQDGGVVLLSPACASFDQFRNFEQRGAVFTALVNELEEVTA